MGAYLSSPITDKISSDTAGDQLICGASSMQGWRVTQEDAHNCVLHFDSGASLFAVYDGHGGKEVAEYTAQKLPDFIKEMEAYKAGDYEKCLKDAFVQFDATLKEQEVLSVLKEIAGTKEDENESETEEEIGNLKEEAQMPLEEVMAKYAGAGTPCKSNIQNLVSESKKGPLSPFLRARGSRSKDGGSSNDADSSNAADSGVSSSSSSSSVNGVSVESTSDEQPSSNGVEVSASADSNKNEVSVNNDDNLPDSSQDSNIPKSDTELSSNVLVNGESTNHVCEKEVKEEVSSSQENGGGKGKGKKLLKKPPKTPQKENETPEQLFEKFVQAADTASGSSDSESEDETFHGPDSTSDDDNEDEGAGSDEEEDEDDEECSEDEEDSDDEDQECENDEFSMNMTDEPGYDSGCTAVVALVKDKKIYVANAGDSRCVVSKNGEVVEMSFDHKPEDEPEMNRIVKAGGKVTCDGRVNGGLNLSRALGDHVYKLVEDLPPDQQMISPLPDVKVLEIDDDVEFMVLACDGIWNFMSSKEVIDFVRPRLKESSEQISTICEELFDHCLAPNTLGDGTGCDNMTAVIVYFRNSLKPSPEPSLKRPADDHAENLEDKKRQKTETEDVSSTKDNSIESEETQG